MTANQWRLGQARLVGSGDFCLGAFAIYLSGLG